MKLRLELHPSAPPDYRWSCIDDDTYDGAPDSGFRARLRGWGHTAQEAEQEYRDRLADWESEQEGLEEEEYFRTHGGSHE